MKKLIIVDDEFWARDTIKNFIAWKELGLELAGEAENGIEAVELIKNTKPDIVITDMKMPGADGIDLLKLLELSCSKIKVIVVSGYGDFDYTKQAIKSKVCEYILKPVDQYDLNDAIKKCIREISEDTGKDDPFSNDPIASANVALMNVLLKYKETVRIFLMELKANEIKKALEQCFDEIKNMEKIGTQELKKIYSELLSVIEEYFIKNEYDFQEILHNIEELSKSRKGIAPIDELYERLANLFDITVISLSNKRNRSGKGIVYDVKEYIDRNYSTDVSLARLAGLFFISKEYLSKAFKTELGINLTDYSVGIRMTKAKEMICGTGMNYKNIAQAVGYEELPYFYRVFRNYFGFSPGHFRGDQEKKD